MNHLRFYWKDHIDYEILNPETNAEWPYPNEASTKGATFRNKNNSFIHNARNFYLKIRLKLLSQNMRNASINVYELLRCPTCYSEELDYSLFFQFLNCKKCDMNYKSLHGIPRLFPVNVDEFNKSRTINTSN